MADADGSTIGLPVFGVRLARALQPRANPDHAARYIDWLTFRDPLGPEPWRRHWHREPAFFAAACAALPLVVGGST